MVNEKLQLEVAAKIHVWNLSIFPFSLPVNAFLTLATIAIWLADNIRIISGTFDDHRVQIEKVACCDGNKRLDHKFELSERNKNCIV